MANSRDPVFCEACASLIPTGTPTIEQPVVPDPDDSWVPKGGVLVLVTCPKCSSTVTYEEKENDDGTDDE